MKVNNQRPNRINRQEEQNKKTKKSQKKRANQEGKDVNKSELKSSILKIKQATGQDRSKVNKDTKVNEQELFASFIHMKLKDEKPGVAKKFNESLNEIYKDLKDKGCAHAMIKAARRAMNGLVNKQEVLTKEESKEIRKYAIGMAQLDSDKTLLTAQKSSATDSPELSLKEALNRVKENKGLTDSQHGDFKKEMKAEIAKDTKCEENEVDECPKEVNKPECEENKIDQCPKEVEAPECEEVKNAEECETPKEEPKVEEEKKETELPKVVVNLAPLYEIDINEIENSQPGWIIDPNEDSLN